MSYFVGCHYDQNSCMWRCLFHCWMVEFQALYLLYTFGMWDQEFLPLLNLIRAQTGWHIYFPWFLFLLGRARQKKQACGKFLTCYLRNYSRSFLRERLVAQPSLKVGEKTPQPLRMSSEGSESCCEPLWNGIDFRETPRDLEGNNSERKHHRDGLEWILRPDFHSGRSCFLCLSVSGHYSQVVLCAENLMMDSKSFFIIPRVGNRESTKLVDVFVAL